MPRKTKTSKRSKKVAIRSPEGGTKEKSVVTVESTTGLHPGLPTEQGIMKSKKKGRIPKFTKEQKKLGDMKKAIQMFQSDTERYMKFLDHMSSWLQEHQQQVMELFSCYNTSGTGTMSQEDFQLGLRDLGVPCLQFQLHMLAQLLGGDSDGRIDFGAMDTLLRRARLKAQKSDEQQINALESVHTRISEEREEDEEFEEEEGIRRQGQGERPCRLAVTCKELRPCPSCKLGVLRPPPMDKERFALLSLSQVTPDGRRSCHLSDFEEAFPLSTRVAAVVERIRDRLGVRDGRLRVSRDRTLSRETALPPAMSLAECGLAGGPEDSPCPATLYYDHTPELRMCPILNCDHYFGWRRLQV
ncbi:hypothetical protein MATL_G00209920 [Megalops atlanticus]|uniref:EF-hand domain-containing protein n=1 Tax=Megalops atlanticus TaxID=7932 RepID=A0A9D3SWS8_MEGAT|nr:hypothetical protein MATL_G00209920 [Megalops atlanticus]